MNPSSYTVVSNNVEIKPKHAVLKTVMLYIAIFLLPLLSGIVQALSVLFLFGISGFSETTTTQHDVDNTIEASRTFAIMSLILAIVSIGSAVMFVARKKTSVVRWVIGLILILVGSFMCYGAIKAVGLTWTI